MLNALSTRMKAWQAPMSTAGERTPILSGGTLNCNQEAPSSGYSRLDNNNELDDNSQQYFKPPPQPDYVPDTGEWFSYRFDTEGPFFAILHRRGWQWTSRTSWIDLLYLIYMKTRAFIDNPAFQRLVGIICAVLSSFFLSLGFAISKAVNEQVDSLVLYAWRQTFLVLFSVPMTTYCGKPVYFHWRDYRAWGQLTLRTIFGSLNIYCVFKAITFISLTDATVVSTTAPIFCSILAYFILGERFGITEVICSVLVIIGVILNSQPEWLFHPQLLAQGDVVQRIIGLVIAMAGAISGAFSTVLMRTMRSMHFSTVQMVYSYLSVLFTWPIVAILGMAHLPPCSFSKKFALTLIGFTALPMQAFFIIACQREKAGIVSIARASTPVFSFIWQLTIFGYGINGYSLVGDLIIMSSIVGLAVKKVLFNKEVPDTKVSSGKEDCHHQEVTDNNDDKQQQQPVQSGVAVSNDAWNNYSSGGYDNSDRGGAGGYGYGGNESSGHGGYNSGKNNDFVDNKEGQTMTKRSYLLSPSTIVNSYHGSRLQQAIAIGIEVASNAKLKTSGGTSGENTNNNNNNSNKSAAAVLMAAPLRYYDVDGSSNYELAAASSSSSSSASSPTNNKS